MKVLFITPFYPPEIKGGIATFSYNLVKEIKDKVDKIVVFCVDYKYNITSRYFRETYDGVTIYRTILNNREQLTELDLDEHYMWGKMALFTIPVVKEIFEIEGPFSVVHINDDYGAMYIEMLKHIIKVPVVNTMHSSKASFGSLEDSIKRYMLTACDYNMFVSKYLLEFFSQKYENRIKEQTNKAVVYPGVTASINKQKKVQRTISICGRVTQVKNISELLDAAAIVCREDGLIHINIIGDGPEINIIKGKAARLGIIDQISFLGFKDHHEARKIIGQSTIYISTSKEETFGFTILEAMAEGTCVISSNVGAVNEYIENDENGFLYETGNIFQLSRLIIQLLNCSEKRMLFEKNGLYTANLFNWNQTAKEVINVYRKVVGAEEVNNG